MLATLLMIGAVIGAEFGTVAGQRLKGEHLRFLLAGLVLMVSARMAFDLIATPENLYSVNYERRGGGE